MKNLTALFIAVLFKSVLIGQEIYIDMGASTTNFHFTNSNGDVIDGYNAKTYDQLNIGYRHIYDEAITITAGLGYTGLGSSGSISFNDAAPNSNNNVDYDLRYVQLKLGGEYLAYKYEDIVNISAVVQIGVGALTHGTQTLDGTVLSITDMPEDDNQYGNAIVSLNLGASASIQLSEITDLYVNLLGGVYNPLPFSSDGEESLLIYGGSISVGLVVDLNLE